MMIFSLWARVGGVLILFFCVGIPQSFAQDVVRHPDAGSLPDAPAPVAKITAKYIPAGWTAQPLNRREKLDVALRDLYTPESLAGYVLAGGYSHLVNGQPNYGTNSDAFGQRVGAAFARDTSQAIFTDAVFAPLLHEDPRYYVQGPGHGLVYRLAYATTRPLITRNDNGRSTVNGSLLLGYGSAAVLTAAYYPDGNRDVKDIARTYGTSIGGAALGFAFQEFTQDIVGIFRHHR